MQDNTTMPTSTLSSKIIKDVLTSASDKDAASKLKSFQLNGTCRQALEVMRLESMRSKVLLSPFGVDPVVYKQASEKVHYELAFITHLIELSDANIKNASKRSN